MLILPWGEIDLSWGIIPLVIFVFIAMTNASNLTDGLDGLAGWTSFVMLIGLTIIVALTRNDYLASGGGQALSEQMYNLIILGASCAGGVLAFLCFNSYPAKIFMGDTGSLFLGGAVTGLAYMLKYELIIMLVGIVYFCEIMSVVLQVSYFKLTHGKRLFKMAPIHHHFEKLGFSENKIDLCAFAITAAFCIAAFFLIKY